jgi:cobalt/nickel transport system ATP-binding protein
LRYQPQSVPESVPVLSCSGFSFARGGIRALEDVSLEVAKGEMLFLCGPNGAGKTTLLSLLAGLMMADSGEIHLSGDKLDRKTRKEAFRRVGLLAQDPNDQLFCTHVQGRCGVWSGQPWPRPAETERLVDKAMALMEVTELAQNAPFTISVMVKCAGSAWPDYRHAAAADPAR